MARIVLGSLVASMGGSIGGHTYSRNRYGAYIRNKSIPVNPNTAAQQEVRDNFARASSNWRLLTALQRADWRRYAEGTPVQTPSGPQALTASAMYTRSASLELLGDHTLPTSAPALNGLPAFPALSDVTPPALVAATRVLTVTLAAALAGNENVMLFAGNPVPASVVFYGGPYKFLVNEDVGPGVVGTLSTPVTAGQVVHCYMRYRKEAGLWSEPYRFVVTAA